MKERNRISTSNVERERLKAGFGEAEIIDRERVVRAPGTISVYLSIANIL